jgi:HSP20 family protein
MAEWNPWSGMEALRREIDRAFDNVSFGTEPFSRTAFLPGRGARRYPLINLHEDKDALYVEALAPGVDPASLDLSVLRNTLTISGEKKRLAGDIKPEAFHRSERSTGRFVRTVDLPVEVDANRVQADYRNGLLVITLPKAERARPKQINVQVG